MGEIIIGKNMNQVNINTKWNSINRNVRMRNQFGRRDYGPRRLNR